MKMDMMVDMDKFYMDDTPVGIPDFWPNNQSPPPSELEKTMQRLGAINFWDPPVVAKKDEVEKKSDDEAKKEKD